MGMGRRYGCVGSRTCRCGEEGGTGRRKCGHGEGKVGMGKRWA